MNLSIADSVTMYHIFLYKLYLPYEHRVKNYILLRDTLKCRQKDAGIKPPTSGEHEFRKQLNAPFNALCLLVFIAVFLRVENKHSVEISL